MGYLCIGCNIELDSGGFGLRMSSGELGVHMGMTGDTASRLASAILCPSCGEVYDSPERVTEILRNSGFCVNLTCLDDLTHLPFEAVLARKKDGARRSSDRRAV